MAGLVLCDTATRNSMLPFTYTRPVCDCLIGINSIRRKWELRWGKSSSTWTVDYLSRKFPLRVEEDTFWINGSLLPDTALVNAIRALEPGERLQAGATWLAARSGYLASIHELQQLRSVPYDQAFDMIHFPWDLFQKNRLALQKDLQAETRLPLPCQELQQCTLIHPEQIFIETGAEVLCSVLNASDGPIYLSKGSLVMEGCLVRGPFFLGEGSVLKMGTRIYGATSIGPGCVIGGEVKNSVFFGYSNKAHDGYVGDAVIAEWCNLGANTNCSNLKNNVSPVRIWGEYEQSFSVAGTKCGVLMGDYARTGINTMINTGSLIGVSCNVFGGDFPPSYLPSFSWGSRQHLEEYRLDQALRDAAAWKHLKNQQLSSDEQQLLSDVFTLTSPYRNYLSHP